MHECTTHFIVKPAALAAFMNHAFFNSCHWPSQFMGTICWSQAFKSVRREVRRHFNFVDTGRCLRNPYGTRADSTRHAHKHPPRNKPLVARCCCGARGGTHPHTASTLLLLLLLLQLLLQHLWHVMRVCVGVGRASSSAGQAVIRWGRLTDLLENARPHA